MLEDFKHFKLKCWPTTHVFTASQTAKVIRHFWGRRVLLRYISTHYSPPGRSKKKPWTARYTRGLLHFRKENRGSCTASRAGQGVPRPWRRIYQGRRGRLLPQSLWATTWHRIGSRCGSGASRAARMASNPLALLHRLREPRGRGSSIACGRRRFQGSIPTCTVHFRHPSAVQLSVRRSMLKLVHIPFRADRHAHACRMRL